MTANLISNIIGVKQHDMSDVMFHYSPSCRNKFFTARASDKGLADVVHAIRTLLMHGLRSVASRGK